MPSIRSLVLENLAYNIEHGNQWVPERVVLAKCQRAGFEKDAVRNELAALVKEGTIHRNGNSYARIDEKDGARLDVRTYRGSKSMPWQFSARRTADGIVITQARGPKEKFDPVVKRFTIKNRSLAGHSIDFHHAVSRRVWSEDPDRPEVQSQRSEGHVIEFLYADRDGWHIVRPEAQAESTETDDAHYESTNYSGIATSSSFLRAETDSGVKYTEEREYRVTSAILDEYSEVYVLSYYKENEESVEHLRWNVEEAVAYRLVR